MPNGFRGKFTSAPHGRGCEESLSFKAGKACGPGPGSSYRYAHERSQPLASFAGSWAREWSARSPFLTMMDHVRFAAGAGPFRP